MAKIGHDAEPLAFANGQFGSKMPKRFEKRLFEYVKFACEKDGSKKTPNIQKMRAF